MLAWNRARNRSGRLWNVHSDPETAPGALAPRTETAPLAETSPTLTGGIGLYDHSARDPISVSAGLVTGIGALVLTAIFAFVLVGMNPALASGKASGTPNQLGSLAAAGGGAL